MNPITVKFRVKDIIMFSFFGLCLSIFLASLICNQLFLWDTERYYGEVLNDLRPEFKDIKFYSKDEVFKPLFVNQSLLGQYNPETRDIIIILNNSELSRNRHSIKSLICHELHHFLWYYHLSISERREWNTRYDELVETYGKDKIKMKHRNSNELYANEHEYKLDLCFVN